MTLADPALLQAYLRTTYVADPPGGPIHLRIGENSAALDALLRQTHHQTWAFVSACNPRSQPLCAAENALRHEALLGRVRTLGLLFYAGRGVADDGGWIEESLLILGISEADALALGRAFVQNAVVVGRIGGMAELKWCQSG